MAPKTLLTLALAPLSLATCSPHLPFVINTWGGAFTAATDSAYTSLLHNSTALDAVQTGCTACEENQCDGSVGFGGSPGENCETTLDAMIMDGSTMKSGSVAALRRVKNAVGVARAVLDYTSHTMLAGDLATQFAVEMGFTEEGLGTEDSKEVCEAWKEEGCQPNYRMNVIPNAESSCGPYEPGPVKALVEKKQEGHDTISQIAISKDGVMAAATTTNGARHKVPGRVGDGPITGSGSYVDGDVGGCGATGDGDIMMRFLPCYQAVENMRNGMSPTEAAEDAVRRMTSKYPEVSSGLVVVDRKGNHGGAASGWTFTYSFRGGKMEETEVVTIESLSERMKEL